MDRLKSPQTEEVIPRGLEEKIRSFNESVSDEGWRARVNLEPKTPILKNGLNYLNTRQDLLLALCLHNGYFSAENIYRMMKFALTFSDNVRIFTTEGPAKHNLLAYGRSEDKVKRSTRLDGNGLINRVQTALARINADAPPEAQKTVSFSDWDDIYTDPAYVHSHQYIQELFRTNSEFQDDIKSVTQKVLGTPNQNLTSKLGSDAQNTPDMSIGVNYVLEELAFIRGYSEMTNQSGTLHGAQGFNYMYSESWPVFEKLINGTYDTPTEGIGFAIVKIEDLKKKAPGQTAAEV